MLFILIASFISGHIGVYSFYFCAFELLFSNIAAISLFLFLSTRSSFESPLSLFLLFYHFCHSVFYSIVTAIVIFTFLLFPSFPLLHFCSPLLFYGISLPSNDSLVCFIRKHFYSFSFLTFFCISFDCY